VARIMRSGVSGDARLDSEQEDGREGASNTECEREGRGEEDAVAAQQEQVR